MLSKFKGSYLQALRSVYPEHTWNSWRLYRYQRTPGRKGVFSKTQLLLFQHLQSVSFPYY